MSKIVEWVDSFLQALVWVSLSLVVATLLGCSPRKDARVICCQPGRGGVTACPTGNDQSNPYGTNNGSVCDTQVLGCRCTILSHGGVLTVCVCSN